MFEKYLSDVAKGSTIDDVENVFDEFSTLYRRSMKLEEKDSAKGLLLFHCVQQKIGNLGTVFEWLLDNKEWRALSGAVSLSILSNDLNTHIEILNQLKNVCGDYLYADGPNKEEKNGVLRLNIEHIIRFYTQTLATYYGAEKSSEIPSELVEHLPDVVCEKLCEKIILNKSHIYDHPTFLKIVFKTPSKGVTEFLDYIKNCRYDSRNDPFAKLLLDNQTTINTFLDYDVSQFGNRQWNITENEFHHLKQVLSTNYMVSSKSEWNRTEGFFKEILKMFPIEQLSEAHSQRLSNLLPYFSDETLRSSIEKSHLHHEIKKTLSEKEHSTRKTEKRKM